MVTVTLTATPEVGEAPLNTFLFAAVVGGATGKHELEARE